MIPSSSEHLHVVVFLIGARCNESTLRCGALIVPQVRDQRGHAYSVSCGAADLLNCVARIPPVCICRITGGDCWHPYTSKRSRVRPWCPLFKGLQKVIYERAPCEVALACMRLEANSCARDVQIYVNQSSES